MKEIKEKIIFWKIWRRNWENAKRFFDSKGNIYTRSKLKDKWYREFESGLLELFSQEKAKEYERGARIQAEMDATTAKKEKEKLLERIERIKLDMDVVVCDCGSPYRDSDPADLINELLEELKEIIDLKL